MSTRFVRSPAFVGVCVLVTVTSLTSSSGGVQSGGAYPANCASQLPSCSSCHSGSSPTASGPTTTLTVANNRRALAQGEMIAVTTAVNGGVAGTTGGFVCEATAGAFTGNGTTTQVISNPLGVTHLNGSTRTWNYTYTAPNTVGPVELTSVGLATDGSSTGGDLFSFNGFDRAAGSATPVRLFVLPAGVTNVGSGCADGFGNVSVLGANGTPTVGNASFAFQLLGASPGQLAVVWGGLNPVGFTPMSLNSMGLTGCTSYLANIIPSWTATTSGSAASTTAVQRAEGTATFPLPIPNTPALQGQSFDAQAGYVDPSVAAIRSLPLTFTNGLHLAIP